MARGGQSLASQRGVQGSTAGLSMGDAKIYCCVSMQIPVFGTQFGNCENTDMILKQMKIILDLLFQFIGVFLFLISRCLVCPNHTKLNHIA